MDSFFFGNSADKMLPTRDILYFIEEEDGVARFFKEMRFEFKKGFPDRLEVGGGNAAEALVLEINVEGKGAVFTEDVVEDECLSASPNSMENIDLAKFGRRERLGEMARNNGAHLIEDVIRVGDDDLFKGFRADHCALS